MVVVAVGFLFCRRADGFAAGHVDSAIDAGGAQPSPLGGNGRSLGPGVAGHIVDFDRIDREIVSAGNGVDGAIDSNGLQVVAGGEHGGALNPSSHGQLLVLGGCWSGECGRFFRFYHRLSPSGSYRTSGSAIFALFCCCDCRQAIIISTTVRPSRPVHDSSPSPSSARTSSCTPAAIPSTSQ